MLAVALIGMLGAGSLLAQGTPTGALRLDSNRFTVLHYPRDAAMARAVLEAATMRDSFPALPRSTERIVILIAPDAATFRKWAGTSAFAWAAAVAFVDQRRVVIQGGSAPSDAGNPIQVLRHELAHIALHDYLGDLPPRWFEEGYASYAAGEERTEGFVATNVALVFRRMPTLAGLDTMLASRVTSDAQAAYALSLHAVSDLASIDRERGLEPLITAWKSRRSFDLALRRSYAITAERFESDWRSRARWQYAFLAIGADSVLAVALMALGIIPLWRSRRRAQRERLDAMRAREAITERASQSEALDVLIRAIASKPARSDADA